jgi:hypothetical protein
MRPRADRLAEEDDPIPAALMIEDRVKARLLGVDVRDDQALDIRGCSQLMIKDTLGFPRVSLQRNAFGCICS